ncbi:MAG: cyclic nucleotide-binding domain-containing protein [Proteobacteria bacterium]|nr:cyclic nucleotide-binding domain-containing protein [Pseudomonadota bacterium]MBU1687738.1 cyclic nucleotide-binding domain-containing protein [Pseudomonadota bacterium]
MKPEDRVKYLRTIDLFEHFSNDEIWRFARNVTELEIPAGHILFHEGEPGNEMYILLAGELNVKKETKFITNIKPVDYIGEMAIIESKPRSATVDAVSASTLLTITNEQFQEYFSTQPESLVSLMRSLSHRIRRNTEIIAEEFEKANILIHDMKNQMASFFFLDLLEKKIEDESVLRLIRVMKGGRDNLAEMMAEALALAKRLSHPRHYISGSLRELINEVMESEVMAHPDLKDRQVDFALSDQEMMVNFCSLEIHRVLVNLILNAAQASPANQSIDVALDYDDQYANVRIMDRGAGIPEEYHDRIFETHFTTKENGNGLGLASCKYVVERLHGGLLSYASRDGGGTVFSFSLPLHV